MLMFLFVIIGEGDMSKSISISEKDLNIYGCVACNYPIGSKGAIWPNEWYSWHCEMCDACCIVFQNNITKSTIGVIDVETHEGYYPEVQEHPRKRLYKGLEKSLEIIAWE